MVQGFYTSSEYRTIEPIDGICRFATYAEAVERFNESEEREAEAQEDG